MDKYTRSQRKLLNHLTNELEEALKNEYDIVYGRLYEELLKLYNKIIDEDGKPLLSHLYEFDRYYKVAKLLQDKIKTLGKFEEKEFTKELTKMYKDNSSLLKGEFHLSTDIDEETIKQVLNTDWAGRSYSTSIWGDKSKLVTDIKQMLIDYVVTGKPVTDYSKALEKRFGQEYWKSERLVRTEMVRMQVESTLRRYKEAGVKKVKILVTEDDRTCGDCLSRQGSVVNISEAEVWVNVPPFHPNCRCTIIPVIEK